MSLDVSKLQNVREQGGKTIARCPACAEAGMDETGEHLVIQPDGRFGCVVHPGPAGKPHRQRIAKLAGTRGVPVIRVRVAPLVATKNEPVRVLANVPRIEPRCSLRNELATPLPVAPPFYSLECCEPGFREPESREWIVGLYRQDDGTLFPLLLWADPKVDYFYDVARRRHVLPPRLYLHLAAQPQIDPVSGHPIIDGVECPF